MAGKPGMHKKSVEDAELAAAQDLASRIWSGQSDDLPVNERVRRIANALKERGMTLDIELPHEDAKRYMNAHR